MTVSQNGGQVRVPDKATGFAEDAEERQLQGEGVVPRYTLEQLAPEPLQDGQAPWCASMNVEHLLPYRQGCPPLLIGGSAFGQGIFSDDDLLHSTEPYRIVRLAFRYGIRAVDTSPFYHPSEITLGRILRTLAPEYPRHTYYLQTKVGRYGQTRADFDYSPQRVRSSVETSLERLGTDYLDSAIMHDVEFVCDKVGPSQDPGFAARDAVQDQRVRRACGLFDAQDDKDADRDDAAKIYGAGDAAVLAAVQTLFALKDEGKVRNVGIGGYPLPTLVRLSRLIASHPPYRSVDVIVNYCHHTLHNDLLPKYAPLFAQEPASFARRRTRAAASNGAQIATWTPPTLINASPFGMGLLTDKGPPDWHPATEGLKQACQQASKELLQSEPSGSSLAGVAALYGLGGAEIISASSASTPQMSTIVGMNSVEQVHQAVQSYRVVLAGAHLTTGKQPLAPLDDSDVERLQPAFERQECNQRIVAEYIDAAGMRDWSWASPPS